MPTSFEVEDVRLFWVEDLDVLSLKGFDLPSATVFGSLAEALEQVRSADRGERRPWIQVDGVLFGPAHVEVLSRRVGRKRDGLTLSEPSLPRVVPN